MNEMNLAIDWDFGNEMESSVELTTDVVLEQVEFELDRLEY